MALGGLPFLVVAAVSVGTTQVPPVTPSAPAIDPSPRLRGQYGDPEAVSLHDIVSHPQFYQQRMVRTRGLFDAGFDRSEYRLREEHDQVLLLSVSEGNEFDMLVGRSVDVVGVVRRLRPKQYVNGKDLDKIEDPDLPVLPAPDSGLPRVTLSFLSMFDATPLAHRSSSGGALADLVRNPGAGGRSVKVVGQFRGANLFGDLPDLPGRDADAFVLKEGETAIWVVGKAAAGKGFLLDPRLRADSRFWLEVEGRLEPCPRQTCLRARRIQLTTRPAEAEP
jgi:hypothetical protein